MYRHSGCKISYLFNFNFYNAVYISDMYNGYTCECLLSSIITIYIHILCFISTNFYSVNTQCTMLYHRTLQYLCVNFVLPKRDLKSAISLATICMADIRYYYTSEEFFLYKITVDKRTIHHFSRQNELLTGT